MSNQTDSPNSPSIIIETQGLSKFYPEGNTWALKDVNLKIEAGERVAIMGPSGCGKSTMLNLFGALDRPTEGRILFFNKVLHENVNVDHYRSRSVGFVFQSFYLLPSLTVLENVQIPMFELHISNRQRVARAREVLEEVGLAKKLHQLPSTLSGGERQRTAIARAIVNTPEILLADEPTGNLDSTNAQGVLDLFDGLCEEHHITLVMVTHDPHVAHRAQRTIRMKDGQVVS